MAGAAASAPDLDEAALAAAAPSPAASTPASTSSAPAALGKYTVPVFNTYQAYLRDVPSRLALAIQRAEREGWTIGVKLVRGAYMRQERERAAAMGYKDPCWPSIEGTHACYSACADLLLATAKSKRGAFMLATHNTKSCLAMAEALLAGKQPLQEQQQQPPSLLQARMAGGVSFGQLLGMSDALTYSLAHRGLSVFKYVPYGPVAEVTPYLLRRGEENSDLLTSNVGAEISTLQEEIWARLFGRRGAGQ